MPFLSIFSRHADHLDLHSFPTRRSSDLVAAEPPCVVAAQDQQVVLPVALEVAGDHACARQQFAQERDRKSTRLNSSHVEISYAVFCLKKKKRIRRDLISIVLTVILVAQS